MKFLAMYVQPAMNNMKWTENIAIFSVDSRIYVTTFLFRHL